MSTPWEVKISWGAGAAPDAITIPMSTGVVTPTIVTAIAETPVGSGNYTAKITASVVDREFWATGSGQPYPGDGRIPANVVEINGVGVTPLDSLIVNQVSTGGNLFTSNLINEVMEIPQGMAWSNDELTPITVLETGRNWPDLGDYPAGTGGLGVYLELAIRPQYTNLASYPGTPAASLVIPCTVTGSPGSQVITIRPDSTTANLMPTNAATNGPNGFPYTAQIWASAGPSDEVLLFRGFATIVEDARS